MPSLRLAVVSGLSSCSAWLAAASLLTGDSFEIWKGYGCRFRSEASSAASVWLGYEQSIMDSGNCAELCLRHTLEASPTRVDFNFEATVSTPGCIGFMYQHSSRECWLYNTRPLPVPDSNFECGWLSPRVRSLYRNGSGVLLPEASGRAPITIDDVALGYELLVNTEGAEAFMFGVRASQDPMTLALLQEHIWALRPELIVEVGTECGGLASIMAELQRLMGLQRGRVLTMDIAPDGYAPWAHVHCEARRGDSALWRRHLRLGRIRPIIRETHRWACPCGLGDDGPLCECCEDDDAVSILLKQASAAAQRVMVIDDSNHFKGAVVKNFELFAPFVTKGSLYIVADTRLDRLCEMVQLLNYPVSNGFNPGEQVRCDYYVGNGPASAVQELFATSELAQQRFRVDRGAERVALNSNPGGWLRAI